MARKEKPVRKKRGKGILALFVLILTGTLDGPLSMLHRGFGFLICTLFGMPNIF